MNICLGEKTGKIYCAIILFCMIERRVQNGVLRKTAVTDRHGDLRIILIEHFAGAERHVADFAVADFAPWKADGDTRGLNTRHGIVLCEPLKNLRLHDVNRI